MEHFDPRNANHITRKYFDTLMLEMRHIDAVIPNTQLDLFGHQFDTPVMMAALSHLNKCHPDGLIEMARGAAKANAVMWAGMGEDAEIAGITATGAKTIKIVKPSFDNNEVIRELKHAEAVGCIAVGMDIDHQFNRRGVYDNVLGFPMRAKSLDDIKSFVASTRLPFILKGVLSVTDAHKCIDAGVSSIVVSHHHGIMDYAVPPLMVLPEIANAVGGKMKIFIDCGFESGMDVFKALALGADAVSVGRAMMAPLTENGAEGVYQAIIKTTEALAGAMAMTASKNIKSIDPSIIRTF